MTFLQELNKRLLFFDGAMGTQLQHRGLPVGELPESWNLCRPEVVKAVYTDYLQAGVQVTKANTFGVNCYKLKNTPYRVKELVQAGLRLAHEAIDEYERTNGEGEPHFVALDIGSLGRLLQPLGSLAFEEAYEAFAQIVRAGASQADVILIETMNDPYEMKAALLAAKEHSELPVIVSMVVDEKGRLLTGGEIPAAVSMLEGLGADVIGLNCALGPKQMRKLMPTLTGCCSLPTLLMPNAGLPELENGQTVYRVGPEEFADDLRRLLEKGAQALGGCCGTTPEHIRAMVQTCQGAERQKLTAKQQTVVSSYGMHVVLGDKPVIIGERINPTGKKKLKQALREQDYDYILEEALKQQENGAHILDVNVGLPEIDEAATMDALVRRLQSVTKLPLQIDTANARTMERALRCYNGKALINSVSGKAEVMAAIFPLVKKYGGVVVGLTLDENGIPDTAEGRVAIAKKIIDTAASFGIAKKDIVIDTLTMTMSTGEQQGCVTLEAMERVRRELGVGTVLGVSNISFGLPNRELVNAAFFTMALDRGLSAGIINPSSAGMRRAYDIALTLKGFDPNCENYIAAYSEEVAVAPPSRKESGAEKPQTEQVPASPLQMAVIKGMADSAFRLAADLLQEKPALTVIDEELVPALDLVGRQFEVGRMFLPQLLMSAQAAQAAFGAIRDSLKGQPQQQKGRIVMATVKGDIHDIGKNITTVLLENYGYEVIDLGKDAAPEAVAEAVVESGAPLVGLSALMTTTVAFMEETIALLRKRAPFCKVMVGGAVLTQAYADQIGADFYAKDAMQGVRYAEQVFRAGQFAEKA